MQLFSSWTGSDFLLFYIMLLGVSAAAAWWIPARLRSEGRQSESVDAEDVALLVNGRARHVDSVIADLFARGGLNHYGGGKVFVCADNMRASDAGRALLGMSQPFSRREARRLLAVHATRAIARLRRDGLLLRTEDLNRLRWFSITPFVALVLLGVYRQRAGVALDEPTGYLVMLLALTFGLAVIRFLKFDQRTLAGIEAVDRLRRQSSRLARAPQPDEAAMAVALFGTGVLVGTPWAAVHKMRQQGGSGSSDGGSDSGGDSNGDSGSSGCGGCGD